MSYEIAIPQIAGRDRGWKTLPISPLAGFFNSLYCGTVCVFLVSLKQNEK
jgi:hypothetical protein